MILRVGVLFLCLAVPALAQGDAGAAARAASAQLEAAAAQLDSAASARDRVRALTQTVRGFEEGLSALRDGLRDATVREIQFTRELQSREADISRLLGVLTALGQDAGPQALLHPQGPVGSARTGMLLAAVAPGLADRAARLRADLEEATALRQLQQDAARQLQEGLSGVQTARTALSQAIADRTDLPRRFTEDPVQTALLIAATETLEGFASGLSALSDGATAPEGASVAAQKGTLPLPVEGLLLRAAGEADAAGVTRPGIVLATAPQALVTTPVSATVRYAGPILDYGLVTILEPQEDLLFVLAGLGTVFGETGQVLPAGSPVGLMGGTGPETGDAGSLSGERGGNPRPETLYIEVRQGEAPLDPLDWFTTDKG